MAIVVGPTPPMRGSYPPEDRKRTAMFRIRRIQDGAQPEDAATIAQVQEILRTQFPAVDAATVEALDCEAGAACLRGLPSELGAPAFMRIDLDKKIVAGPKRSTPIVSMERNAESLLLQGTEIGYGWTLAVDTKQGTMAATLVNREGAFVLFGSCTPL